MHVSLDIENDERVPSSKGTVTSHPAFAQPADATECVWRYLNLRKFADLVSNKHLCFSRIDKFPDPFEGSVVRRHNEGLDPNCWVVSYSPSYSVRGSDLERLAKYRKMARYGMYAVCWQLGGDESDLMWRSYCEPKEAGLAVALRYDRLAESVSYYTFNVGCVRYIDYETETFPDAEHGLHAAMHKRRAFADEREVRVVHVPNHWVGRDGRREVGPDDTPPRRFLRWDPEVWVESIVVSPYASEDSFREIVAAVRQHAPTLESKISYSKMLATPTFA